MVEDVSVPVSRHCAVAALPRRDVRLAPTVQVSRIISSHHKHILILSQNAARDAAKCINS